MKECSVRNSGVTASQKLVHSPEFTCSLNNTATTTTANALEFTSITDQSQPELDELPIQKQQELQHTTRASTNNQQELQHQRELQLQHRYNGRESIPGNYSTISENTRRSCPPLASLQSNGRAMNLNPLKLKGLPVSGRGRKGGWGLATPSFWSESCARWGQRTPFGVWDG